MPSFMVDTTGDQQLVGKGSKYTVGVTKNSNRVLCDEELRTQLVSATLFEAADNDENDDGEESEYDVDYYGIPSIDVDLSKIIEESLQATAKQKTEAELILEHYTNKVNQAVARAELNLYSKKRRINNFNYDDFNEETGKFDDEQLVRVDVAKEMSQSLLKPGFEQLKDLPRLRKDQQRKLNRLERAKTKGPAWYNLPATELTEENTNDLKILQMRSVLNPKHFYKKNDLKVLPKYFQTGTVQHSPLDFYSERNTRKNKKRTLVEEIMADNEVQTYTKRKYKEVMVRKDKYAHRKAMQKMKKLKKNK